METSRQVTANRPPDGSGRFDALTFHLIRTREDRFASRYFDAQKSRKFLADLDDRGTQIEVSLYEHYLAGALVDSAIDISTMVGCPMKCAFCASASIDFVRALNAGEIVAQVAFMLREYVEPACPQVTCSFQGIGEPSLAAGQVLSASRALLELDARIVLSLSTIGASRPGLEAILGSGVPFQNVQFTMCGTTENVVRSLMPGALLPREVVLVAKEWALRPHLKMVKVNYILMAGANDGQDDVDYLVAAFEGSPIAVKISCLNRTRASASANLSATTLEAAANFSGQLRKGGIDSYVFGAFSDIELSCGQLMKLEGS
jgi:23S rRNA (adenine2503-C2)-methyltransferase